MRPLVLLSSLATGGAERVTVSFVRRAHERGVPIALCTLQSRDDGPLARELAEAGVPRHDLDAKRLVDPSALVRYMRLLRRESIDVVHAHGQDAAVMAWMARRLARSRVPYAVTRHVMAETGAFGGARGMIRSRLAGAAFRGADLRVAVSSAVARAAGDKDTRILRNGIDVERFDAPDVRARRDALREALGIPHAARVVVTVAVLRQGKGHARLLEAWPRVLEWAPGAVLLLAGDGELMPALRTLARDLGPSVRFLGARQDIPELLAASDVACLPSLSEALPTSLMEAAAAGLPTVATDAGGTEDVVLHGETGLLLPLHDTGGADPDELARSLALLLNDPDRARAMGETARERARELFTIDRQVDETLDAWRELLRSGRRT